MDDGDYDPRLSSLSPQDPPFRRDDEKKTPVASSMSNMPVPRSYPASAAFAHASTSFDAVAAVQEEQPKRKATTSRNTRSRPYIQVTLDPPLDLEPDAFFVEVPGRKESFYVQGCSHGELNVLRRLAGAVPIMKFVYVRPDPMRPCQMNHQEIAHNIGLLTVQSSAADRIRHINECDCPIGGSVTGTMGCRHCTIRFRILKENTSMSETLTVTDRDLVLDRTHAEYDAAIHPLFPLVYEKRPIVLTKLGPGDSIDFLCLLRKENAMRMPIAKVVVRFAIRDIFDIRVDRDKEAFLRTSKPFALEAIVERCPRQVFSYHEIKKQIQVDAPLACSSCDECQRIAIEWKVPGLITIESRPRMHELRVETTGALTPRDVLRRAAQIMIQRCNTWLSIVESDADAFRNCGAVL